MSGREEKERLGGVQEDISDILELLPEHVQEAIDEGRGDVWRRIYIRPRKALGQHLLRDPSYLKLLVEHAQVGPDDVVVELGAGSGTLTRFILEANPKHLYTVERDYRFYMNLVERLGDKGNLTIIHGDLRELSLREIASRSGVPSIKVLGNIPFNLSGFIVRMLVEGLEVVSLASLTFQREFVSKLAASAGDPPYSFLSVGVQTFFRVQPKEVIPPWKFIPPPKVYSQIALLVRKDENLWDERLRERYFRAIRDIFQRGRKRKLLRALRDVLNVTEELALQAMRAVGLEENVRVFQVKPEEYERLIPKLLRKR